ncbi:tetratricopeptide repeat protein [Jannaschia aquimarina]|uniref:Lipoprotein NlpI n=1 Tax=Jannaschia aquimarina TaxID=935700 RepID=A0A0D1EIA1_9RHOB|nr:tetratricopeptide repeat protein [Jannaschia aquimarina]KIT16641.1 lipoprotein NlpI [Jannaschia aquimarina]SNS93582.1 Tetratricopeptide repeat-containing protein [Jannaschia aquimarina]
MFRTLILATALLVPATVQAQNVAGPYLAARVAGFSNDYAVAARNFDRLLRRDDVPDAVLDNAIVVYSALGRFDRAAQAATRLEEMGRPSRFGASAQMVDALIKGEIGQAHDMLSGDEGVGGALLDGLLLGWIAMAEDDLDGARAAFDALAEQPGFDSFAHLHLAYALASAGEFEEAQGLLSGETEGPLNLTTRGVEAQAQVLMQLDRSDDALELLEQANAATNSPILQDLQARIEAGEEIPWTFLPDARAGMAEAFFTLAAILAGETSATFTLLNAQATISLRPDHVDGLILVGELFDSQDQYALAAEVLRRVPANHPAFFGAEIARSEVLLSSEREEAAVEVLQGLTRDLPENANVWIALGDTLRRLDRFEGAADAYNRAIDLQDEIEPRDWFLFYARGIAYERTDRFDLAEPDFRRALELNPDQPLVLNYLGYSLVEERIKLDEALDMIERAVEARPDDGYITDSLGWVLYRLGRFEEAVAPMERAVQLTPLDPLINDHLGDVLWMVGRKREARFQWRRALSLEPEEQSEVERIRRKLDVGLDVVLEEEGGVGARETAQD